MKYFKTVQQLIVNSSVKTLTALQAPQGYVTHIDICYTEIFEKLNLSAVCVNQWL